MDFSWGKRKTGCFGFLELSAEYTGSVRLCYERLMNSGAFFMRSFIMSLLLIAIAKQVTDKLSLAIMRVVFHEEF